MERLLLVKCPSCFMLHAFFMSAQSFHYTLFVSMCYGFFYERFFFYQPKNTEKFFPVPSGLGRS